MAVAFHREFLPKIWRDRLYTHILKAVKILIEFQILVSAQPGPASLYGDPVFRFIF
jgi:hypothetical protein